MSILETRKDNRSGSFSWCALFPMLPMGGAIGCWGRARAMVRRTTFAANASRSAEKADVTWEEIFRFAYQKGLIPVFRELRGQLGCEESLGMLR